MFVTLQYIIAVYTAVDSEFEITATFTDGIATLVNQIPQPGSVPPGQYRYYALDILNIDVELTVALTILSGTADLYVSVNSSNRRPTAAWYDQAFIGTGGDAAEAVVFSWDQLPECPDSSVEHTVFCHAYIGVCGRADSGADSNSSVSYTIVADAAKPNQTAMLLMDGVPSAGVIK